MKKTFWLFILLLLPFIAAGNGKVWPQPSIEGVPPDIPYQRALIVHHDNEQVLILQTRFDPVEEITEESEYCWVIPVPSEAEFEFLNAPTIENVFRRVDSLTYPNVIKISKILQRAALVLLVTWFVLSIIFCLVCPMLLLSFNVKWLHKRKKILTIIASIGIIIPPIIFLAVFSTVFGYFLGGMPSHIRGGVQVIRSQSVGPYDAFLLKAETSSDLRDWLTENGFAYYEEDEPVLEEYIEKGWFFVFTRIKPGIDPEYLSAGEHGLIAPIVLRFHSEFPVYPLALTSTVGVDTEVVIYLLSDKRMSAGERMALHASLTLSNWVIEGIISKLKFPQHWHVPPADDNIRWEESEHIEEQYLIYSFEDWDPEFRYLSKFKATLSPEQMRQDLVFYPDEELTDYRKRVIRW